MRELGGACARNGLAVLNAADLAAVRWDEALGALERAHRAGVDARARRLYAEALSLSALYAGEYGEAARRVADAAALEPLNPLHRVRRALVLMRFGRAHEAADALDELARAVPGVPRVEYLRALALLRAGDARRAANVAGQVQTSHPGVLPAHFLAVDGFLRGQFKGIEPRLQKLPRPAKTGASDPALANAWADLLLKLLAAHPTQAPKVVRGLLEQGVVPAGSPAREAVARALAWAQAESPEALARELEAQPHGSRSEQMVLLFFAQHEQWKGDGGESARLRALRALHAAHPDRPNARRVYVAALTQHAVDLARQERYDAALRSVEACLALEPHETAHHQNRAALLTLMVGDPETYHAAWADLDRHHYRLALLGRAEPAFARVVRRPHRMFAQQARLTPRAPGQPVAELGVLRERTERGEGELARTELEVNQARIDADPDQLRQWIHHRRAELVFSHLALGLEDPARALLDPDDALVAAARVEGLARAAGSLAVLAPEEGELLAARLTAPLRAAAPALLPRYDASPASPAGDRDASVDAEREALRAAHLETLADLALLCLSYDPSPARPEAVDELLEMLAACAPFFDERVLYRALDDRERTPSRAVQLLAMFVRTRFARRDAAKRAAGDGAADERDAPAARPALAPAQRAQVARSLGAALVCRLALEQSRAVRTHGQQAIERALTTLERARALDADDAAVEFHAARLLLAGGYLEESRAALARFHALARPGDEAYKPEAEEVARMLEQRRREGSDDRGRRTTTAASAVPAGGATAAGQREADLEREIERFPGAVGAYESLARMLAAEGRFDAAVACAERAVGRCLSREGQLRARALHLELLGLRELGAPHATAIRLFLAGSADALERALPDAPAGHYAVEYLRGLCRLARKQPLDAGRAFADAVARCGRQLHLAVLRPLADDPEGALVRRSSAAVADALDGGRLDDARRELAEVWSRCRAREKCLVQLARIELAAAVAALGEQAPPADARAALALEPPAPPDAPWAAARFREACALADPLARVRALCAMVRALYAAPAPPPASLAAELLRDAAALERKVAALEAQVRLARALTDAAAALQADRVEQALARLDEEREAGEAEPRWRKLQVVALVRLERFDDADRAVEALSGARDPAARELLERYPELAFRHRISAATRRMRARELDAARAILATTRPARGEDRLELAYCEAFCLALEAGAHQDAGRRADAVRALERALERLEPLVREARASGNARLVELYTQLDQDCADLKEARR